MTTRIKELLSELEDIFDELDDLGVHAICAMCQVSTVNDTIDINYGTCGDAKRIAQTLRFIAHRDETIAEIVNRVSAGNANGGSREADNSIAAARSTNTSNARSC